MIAPIQPCDGNKLLSSNLVMLSAVLMLPTCYFKLLWIPCCSSVCALNLIICTSHLSNWLLMSSVSINLNILTHRANLLVWEAKFQYMGNTIVCFYFSISMYAGHTLSLETENLTHLFSFSCLIRSRQRSLSVFYGAVSCLSYQMIL